MFESDSWNSKRESGHAARDLRESIGYLLHTRSAEWDVDRGRRRLSLRRGSLEVVDYTMPGAFSSINSERRGKKSLPGHGVHHEYRRTPAGGHAASRQHAARPVFFTEFLGIVEPGPRRFRGSLSGIYARPDSLREHHRDEERSGLG